MTADASLTLFLPTPEDTDRLGRALAEGLGARDTLLLSGSVGSGKTHLARAVVRALTTPGEDVPSPSFTLVQTYDTSDGRSLWHVDLYRLSHPDEAAELGLDAAFEHAICLVEWPDRLGTRTPADALRVGLAVAGEGRLATLSGGMRWAGRIAALAGAAA